MKKLLLYPAIVLMISAGACTKMLDITPVSSMTVASFWKTSDDAKGALAGMYSEFRDLGDDLFLMGEARSETMGDAGGRNADWRIKYFENTITAQNADLGWQQLYKVIGTANLIITHVPQINFSSESEKNDLVAQAYTMRAFVYFALMRTWGDVPLITDPIVDIDPSVTFRSRTPATEIVSLIEQDLATAMSLYPDNSLPHCRCLWSKPATHLLDGDVKLWKAKVMGGGNSDLELALAALEEAEKADVQLLSDYGDVFDYNNKGNKEVFFAIHYNRNESTNNYYYEMYPLSATIALGDEQTQQDLGPGGNIWWSPSAHVVNQFHEDDLRGKASFYSVYHAETNNFLVTGLTKYKGISESNTRRFIDDIIVYRYAELLLLKAEAKNALNEDPSAEINQIRQRAFGAAYIQHEFQNTSQAENDATILAERLFELGWEGKRWWDLVRFGKAYELVPSLHGLENSVPLLFPIDQKTLTRNSNLTQTEGYN